MYNRRLFNPLITMIIMLLIMLYFTFSMISCTSSQTNTSDRSPIATLSPTPKVTSTPVVSEPFKLYPTLSWEKNHDERVSWSIYLYDLIDDNFAVLDSAQDMSKYCPKYKLLNEDQRKNAWSEFIVALTYYESGWNPKSASVDVGTQSNKDTWSAGLMQMSVVDQKNHNLNFGLKYSDLLLPEPNLKLGIAVLVKQIKKQKLICVSSGVYWAIVSCKWLARYEKNDQVAARVQNSFKECK